jgi:DNA-binding response OmpR family regulator
MLEESGYTVLEAVDGEEAVRLFGERKDAVQLVISDIIMPRQSGKDLQKELKKIDSGVKVLFISGYAADILTQKGIADEGVYFLSKPLVPHILSRKVRAVLDA